MTHLTKNKPFPRKDYGSLPLNLTKREGVEEEVARDLDKSNEQLLADAHEELLQNQPIHAQKRIASLMVRAASSSDRASRILINLTYAIVALTIVLVVLTCMLYRHEARLHIPI